jgi:ferredoxin like protein
MINIENLNQMTRFDADSEPHIVINREICRNCQQKECLLACPAKCYTYSETSGRVDVVYENCLECGTCLLICEKGAIDWSYPRGGYGVYYRMT